MLDTSNLSAFCKGIADAIRKKKGTTEEIQYKKFDEEIENIDTNKGLVEMLESRTNYSYALAYVKNISEVPVFTVNSVATSMDSFFLGSTIKSFPDFIDFSKITTASRICDSCAKLVGSVIVDFSKQRVLSSIFNWCSNVNSIEFKNGTSNANDVKRMIRYCVRLETVKGLDFSKVEAAVDLTDAFSNCISLQTIEFFKDECVKVSFSLGDSPLLTEQSKTNIINALATVTTAPTLTLNSKVTLTDEQIKTINSKGWNLAYVN